MVLLVLAIVWGVLLVTWLRSRPSGALSDSVGSFRRHLRVLERATPSTVMPANRLSAGTGSPHQIPAYRSSAMPALAPRGYPAPSRSSRYTDPTVIRRRQSQRRRRDVFLVLIVGASATLLLAMVPGMSVMWTLQILFDIALVAYVALLVRMRNLEADRQLKLRYLSERHDPRSRRSMPARRGYEFGAPGYDFDFQRVAT